MLVIACKDRYRWMRFLKKPERIGYTIGYGVAKIPFGIPMARAVIREGYSLPMEDGMEAGLAYGIGIRIKPPFFPLGAEANYTVHNLKFEDSEMDLGGVMDYKYKYMNLTVTYSF